MSCPGSDLLMFLCGQPAYLKWLECNSTLTLWWWLVGSELIYPLTDLTSAINTVYLTSLPQQMLHNSEGLSPITIHFSAHIILAKMGHVFAWIN
jgi:hypothetical protein